MQKYLRFYWKAFPSPVHVLWKWDKNTDMTKYKLLSASSSCVLAWGLNRDGKGIPVGGWTTHYDIRSPGAVLLILCLTNSTLTAQHSFIDFFSSSPSSYSSSVHTLEMPYAFSGWLDGELFNREVAFKMTFMKGMTLVIMKFIPNYCPWCKIEKSELE